MLFTVVCNDDVNERVVCNNAVKLEKARAEMSEIKEAQELIDSGDAWRLEGSVGRACMRMIETGVCTLGKVRHKDYYGSYVPSRYEVKNGTKGSLKFKKDAMKRLKEEG